MENKVSYIVDEFGNKTHIVIPIDQWLQLKNKFENNQSLDHAIDIMNAIQDKLLPVGAYDLTNLIQNTDKDFYSAFIKHYSYFDQLSNKDIALLYILRDDEFIEITSNPPLTEDLEYKGWYVKDYLISLKDGSLLNGYDINDFKKFFVTTTSPLSLTSEFNKKYQLGQKNFKKRIRKDAEIKRLFFYDLNTYGPILYPSVIEKHDGKKKFLEHYAELIYPNNSKESAVAQMNKAIRDAEERIYGNWKEYVTE